MRKITTLITLLLTCLTGAMAQEYTIDVSYQNGAYYRQKTWYLNRQNVPGQKYQGSSNAYSTYVGTDDSKIGTTGGFGDWAFKWEANDASGLTIVANNGTVDDNGTTTNKFLCSAHDNEGNSFQTNGSAITWKISVADGYVITGWKLVGQTESASGCANKGYVKPSGGSEYAFELSSTQTVNVTGLNSQETTYETRASGGTQNAQITWSTFQVTVRKVPVYHTLTINYTAWTGEEPFTLTKSIEEGTNVTASDVAIDYYKDFSANVAWGFPMTEDKTINVTCTPNFPFTEGNEYRLRMPYHKDGYQYDIYVNRTATDGTSTTSTVTDGDNGKWIFNHVPNTERLFTIKNVGNAKYLNMPTTTSHSAPDFVSEPTAWTSGTDASSYFYITPYEGTYDKAVGGFILCHPGALGVVVGNHESAKTRLDIWNKDASVSHTDPNSSFFVENAATPTYEIVFSVNAWAGEAPFMTKNKSYLEGTIITEEDFAAEFSGVSFYKDFSANVVFPYTVSGAATIDVTCTPDFPFTVGKVYRLFEGYNRSYATYNNASQIDLTSTTDMKNSSYMFEHVAGEQNKFQLYSFGGKGYVTMSTINDDPSVREKATISETPVVWTSGETSPTSQYVVRMYNGNGKTFDGFQLIHPGNSQCGLSGRSGSYLDTWNSSSVANWQYANLGVEEVNLVNDVPNTDLIEAYSTTMCTLPQSTVDDLLANPTKANVQTYLDNIETTWHDFNSLIDEDGVYQMYFNREEADRYVGLYKVAADANGDPKIVLVGKGNMTDEEANAQDHVRARTYTTSEEPYQQQYINTLWQVKKATDGYYIKHLNSGLYIHGFDDVNDPTCKMTSASDVTPTSVFKINQSSHGTALWNVVDETSTYNNNGLRQTLNCEGGGKYTVGYYTSGDSGNDIRFKKVTSIPLSVSAAGWTAFCFPVKVTVPDGVTVYQATSSNGESLHLEEVAAGTVLPAGAGFLCEAAEGTYNFGITAADAADFSSNLLTGATLRRTGMTPNNFYALGNKNGVGFYRVNSETVPANKPFLPASALTSSVREMLSFDFGMATGISNTQNADRTDTSVLYDLNGRRVYYPVRGIYVNGRGEKIFLNK